MRVCKFGDKTITYHELEDMPPCRACGVAPVIKGKQPQGDRLQCPKCGIRTGQSTSEEQKFRTWLAVMG